MNTGQKQRGSLLASLVVVILLAAAVLLTADYVLQPDRFPVSRISFVGEFKNVDKQALQTGVSPYIGQNFFAIDLNNLEKKLSDIEWVSAVSVSRRWPDTLQVNVTEQRLVASWNDRAWVTSDSHVVEIPQASIAELPRWWGPQGTQSLVRLRHQQFSDLLRDAGLQVNQLRYSERGAWKLVTYSPLRKEKLTINLGRREMMERLYRFVRAYTETLAGLERRIVSVDLRYPNGFAVKWNKSEQGRPATTG
jgi:cell division protein FtsQ